MKRLETVVTYMNAGKWRKLLAMLVAVTLLIESVPLSVFADENITSEQAVVEDGISEAETWEEEIPDSEAVSDAEEIAGSAEETYEEESFLPEEELIEEPDEAVEEEFSGELIEEPAEEAAEEWIEESDDAAEEEPAEVPDEGADEETAEEPEDLSLSASTAERNGADSPAQVKKSITTKTEYAFHGQVFTDKGTLVASPARAAAGETVTLTLEADEYYGIVKDGFTVYDGSNREVALGLEEQADGSYTFVMPDDADNDAYTIVAQIEWTNAPDSGRTTTQNIVIASGIEHGTIYAKYLPYAGSSLYERINSSAHAGAVKTIYDTPKPVWLLAEPEEGYELKAWKVEAVFLDEMDGEPIGSLPVERLDGADESGDEIAYPWLFELGSYYRNSNKYICFKISAEFQEIQEPVYEPHSITVNTRDLSSEDEPTGNSISVFVNEGEELVPAGEAKKGDIVTFKVDLQPGTGLVEGSTGTPLSVYTSSASGTESIEYTPVEGEENTYTFVMPDREVTVFALFSYLRFKVVPAPLPTRSYVRYAFYRNGTGLKNQVGAGYFDTDKETWVRTEGSDIWEARPTDKVTLDADTWFENRDTVPGTLRLLDAKTGEAVGDPISLKAINQTGTEYRAEMTMPARDITFAVDMVPCYTVSVNESDYGLFGSFPKRAREGDKVTIRATPNDSSYDVLWKVTWTDDEGEVHDVEFTKDPDDPLKASFIMPAADVQVTGEFSQWRGLQRLIDEAEDGGTITLGASYTALDTDTRLEVRGKEVTIDLNGYTLNRNLKKYKADGGQVFIVTDGATLTITDSSGESGAASYGEDGTAGTTGTGLITGGWASDGGAFFVSKGAVLNIRGGMIIGNRAKFYGGGISVSDGTLNMTGGIVASNVSSDCGGGIYCYPYGIVNLENVAITGNISGTHGGGLYLRSVYDASIKDSVIFSNSSTKYGGGLRMDGKDTTLTIENTKIYDNLSMDDGGGIHLNDGSIVMDGGTISGNTSGYDGGGVKVTSGTRFEASNVTISGNKASKEEGGGVKNHGETTLVDCIIKDNESQKAGGGLFNDKDGNSAGAMILRDCTVTGNKTESLGGGIYSGKKLTMFGGEISGNTASQGGGVFIGSASEDTGIQGDPVIQDNEASAFANNLYLKSGRKLVLTGPLTDGANISVDLETGTGVLAKGYKTFNGTDEPDPYFTVTKGYETKLNDKGEVEICSEWSALKKEIEGLPNGSVMTLSRDYAAAASDDRITISKDITIDLNGYTLNRNRLSTKDNGHVLEVFGGGTLTLIDSSEEKTGLITGGWSGNGGGIYVNSNGTLNLRGARIAGNRAGDTGGGVYVKGTLNITDGRIEDNTSEKSGGIRVEKGAKITIQGSPQIWGNTARKNGNDLYLSSGGKIDIAGPLTDGAKIGVAIQGNWGVFTSGYGEQNPDEDPALFFESTEGYGVRREDGEAVLGPAAYGGTEYQDPFISGGNQINTNTLGPQNWMSGLSGERRLNEINMPGSHDSGMNNVQNIKTSQGFTWVVAGFTVLSVAASLLTAGTASIGLVGLAGIGLSIGLPNDYTSALGFFLEDAAAPKAKTQREYIDQQLADGCRQLDLRLYHQHKVYKWYINGYKYEDDGENLWVAHGKKGGGRYIAQDDDDDDLSFTQVLTWVKDFLRLHPTETIILDLRPETEDDKEKKKIYPRAKEILESEAMDINPSTGEPYLYKDPESNDYFASYDRMPKLADCRGKIVIMPDNEDFKAEVGGFVRGELISGESLAQLNYQNTQEQMVSQMVWEYSRVNDDGSVRLPADAYSKLNRLWYWELNCTGQRAGIKYAIMDAPHNLAQYVNSHLIGKDKVLGPERTGQYIGWVRMDSFNAKYAEEIWRTNYFDGLKYHTVTVKSGLEDEKHYPDQTYRVLDGTVLTVPGNIYKKLADGQYFAYWETEDGKRVNPDDLIRITGDMTLTAKWLGQGEIPVRAIWKDADDKDGLRPESLSLSISVDEAPADVTITKDDGWSGIIHALEGMRDRIVITPDWEKIDTTSSAYGTDAEGLYRYEINYEAGTGYTITLIHTPKGSVLAAGTVEWEDNDNTAGKRPETVRIRLYKNGAATGGVAEVSAENDWEYTFGNRKQYENGEENFYTVAEDEIENYTAEINGFSVVNTYSPDTESTVIVEGIVQWDDADNSKGLRPDKTLVRLMAGSEEAGSVEAVPSEVGLWYWTIDNVPFTDAEGGRIKYDISPEEVEGYDVTYERISLAEDESGEEADEESYMFLITYTLKVSDEEKTDASVIRAPEARELTYSATAQELIEEGTAEGGKMMYALGNSADTPPEESAFSTALPSGTDAGTYHVWYFVKADVTHRDTEPQLLEVTVGKAAPTLEAADIRITDGDTGKTAGAAVTGVEGSTEGLGVLSYEITEGSAVTVDAATGELTVHTTGIAKLKVSVPETLNYTADQKTVTVTVVHQHKLTKVDAKAATCEEDGNTAHWACSEGDGKCFSDEEGLSEIPKESTVIPAFGHDYGEWTVTKEATETAEGEEKRICKNDPNHVETRVIPRKAHVHKLVKVEAVPATCEEDGNITYWICGEGENPCGRYFSDAEGSTEITSQQTVIPATGHTAGTKEENRKQATCTEAGSYDLVSYCTVCQKELGRQTMTIAALGHDWDEGAVTKEATCTQAGVKTYTCKRDGSHTRTEEIPALGHDWGEWTVTTEATETAEGVETRTCNNDPSHVETRVIPMKTHVHRLAKVEAKAAACEEAGNIAYWVCTEGENPCRRYFADAEGNNEISEEDTVIPALGHDWDEGQVTKEVGCTTEGERVYTCRRDSSHKKTEVISPTGHKGHYEWKDEEISAADCTHEGYYYHIYYCTDCNEVLTTMLRKTPAIGHDFGEWEVTRKATATEPGVKTRYCKHDSSHTENEMIEQLSFTAPAAITGLIYNKEEQALVAAGTAKGGLVQYALGTSAETAPTGGWSESVPAATDAGTYHVWYRIVGDSEHANIAPECIEAAIGKADAVIRYEEESIRKQCDEAEFTNPLTFTGDGTVSYRSDNTAVATVDANGRVTIKGIGTATITAAAADGANYRYDPAAASYRLTVTKKPGTIGFENAAVEKTYGDAAFTNVLKNTGDGTVTYASGDASVATVDPATGEVTIVSAGGTTITATVTDGAESTYAKKTESYQLTVKKAENPGFAGGSTTVIRGGNKADLEKLVKNAEGAVHYAISGEALGCSVDEKTGVFTSGNEAGTVKVSVTFDGNDRYSQKTVEMTVNVADKTVRRFIGSATRRYGEPLNLPIMTPVPEGAVPEMQYTGTLRNGTSYENDEEPAEAGEYILTLTYEDSKNIWLETIAFTILPRELGSPEVILGDPLTYNGSEQTQTVDSVMWGEEAVPASEYTVTDNRGTDAGTYTLTVTAKPDGNYTGSVTKEFAIGKAAGEIRADAESVGKSYGGEAFESGFTVTGDGAVSYASGDESVATVNPVTGEVTIVGVGETTITATAEDGLNYRYEPAEASYVLTVAKKAAEISFDADAVERTYGDESFTNTLLNSGDGTVSYASDNPDVATVDAAAGEVTIVGAGEAVITATVKDGATSAYAKKTASWRLTVKKAENPGFVGGTDAVQVGKTVGLESLVKNAEGTVSYGIDGEDLGCSVDEETGDFTAGYVTGEVMVRVNISGNENYNPKTGTIVVQVSGNVVVPALAQIAFIYGENTLDGIIERGVKFPENVSPSIHYTGTARNGEAYDSGLAPVDAGDYLVTITYENEDTLYKGLLMARILPKSIEEAAVTLGKVLTYNGSEQTEEVASVTVQNPKGVNVVIPATEYTVTGNQATNAGDYTLTVTAKPKGNYTDSVTKEFKVARAKGEIGYAEETVRKTYGDAAFINELSKTGDGTVTYGSGNGAVATVDPATGKVTVVGAGEVNITATVQDGTNYYYDTRTASYRLNVAKAAAAVSAAPSAIADLIYNGTPQTLVTAGKTTDGTMEYALGTDASTAPKDSVYTAEIPAATDAGTWYVWYRVAGDDNHNDNKAMVPVTVTIRKREAELSWDDTPLIYDGTAKAPAAMVKNLVDGDECAVTVEGKAVNAGRYTARAAALSNSNYKLPENTATEFTIQKAAGRISFAAETVERVYGDAAFINRLTNEGDGAVTFSSDNSSVAAVDEGTGFVTLNGVGSATITAKAADGANYHYDPAAVSYRLTVGAAAPSVFRAPATVMDLVYNGSPQTLVTRGEGFGGTMQYVIGADGKNPPADDADWSEELPTGTDAGLYYVWYRIIGDDNHGNSEPVPMNGYIAPVASRGSVGTKTLYYTGKKQDLIEPAEAEGGEMMYALGTDAETAPEMDSETGSGSDAWSSQVPQGKNVGDYYVWYYIKGDGNHRDTAPEVKTVTILPKPVSYEVTFKVSHGSWDNGSDDEIVVKVEGYETENGSLLKLSRADIPAVGNKPEQYYTAGSWNVTPDTDKAVTENTTYTYTYQKVAYRLTEGEGQTYKKKSGESLRFVIKRSLDDGTTFSHFTKVNNGEAALAQGEDYTAASGSLVLILQPGFLETLEPGEHTVKVYFDDVSEADAVPATFSVTAPAEYTVTFDGNGHGTAPEAQTVTDGDKAEKPTDPNAEGYAFGGWYKEKECQNVYDFDTPVTEDKTLYAKWTADSSDNPSDNPSDKPSEDEPSKDNPTEDSNTEENNTKDNTSEDSSSESTSDSSSKHSSGTNADSDSSSSSNSTSSSTSSSSSSSNSTGTSGSTSNSTSNSSSAGSKTAGAKTGDPSSIWLWIMMMFISMIGMSGAGAAYSRNRRKEEYAGENDQE